MFGCEMVSTDSFEAIAEELEAYEFQHASAELPFVYTPNSYNLVLFHRGFRSLFEKLKQSAFILPDGYPLVLTSRMKKTPLKARITGADLFNTLWEKVVAEQKQAVLFITSTEEVGKALHQEYSKANYWSPPFFEMDNTAALEQVVEETLNRVLDQKPKYVFMGIGDPKQQYVGLEVFKRLQGLNGHIPIFLFLGASFEFHLKLRKRAPLLVRNLGFEWLYRFVNEPRKLFYRYFVLGWLFIPLMLKEAYGRSNSQSSNG